MHHKGGVSKAVKFSLAGSTEATTAAVEKGRAAESVLVFNRFPDTVFFRQIRRHLDPGITRSWSGHIFRHFVGGESS